MVYRVVSEGESSLARIRNDGDMHFMEFKHYNVERPSVLPARPTLQRQIHAHRSKSTLVLSRSNGCQFSNRYTSNVKVGKM